MPAASVSTPLLTAEHFAERPDSGYPEELVREWIVAMPQPKPRHGEIWSKADRILGVYVEERDIITSSETARRSHAGYPGRWQSFPGLEA